MHVIQDLFWSLWSIIKTIRIQDIIDILLISFIVYKTFQFAKETRAEQLLKGIILLLLAYFVVKISNMKTMTFLLENIIQSGILALVILFQPELRRALERVGRTKVTSVFTNTASEKHLSDWERAIPIIVNSVAKLSQSKTGALIVLEQETKLGEQIATGVYLDAQPSEELFGNIFFVNTPLHDGAVIMRDGKILAAACFLPKPQKEELIETKLGSRHRASLGISEVSDSITIVVSEETGTVSIAENGHLMRGFSSDRLTQFLRAKLIPQPSEEHKISSLKIKQHLKRGKNK